MTPMPAPALRNELAVQGGPPVRVAPLPPWPHYEQDELDAVREVLASGKVNYWTGQECARFEEEFAAEVGAKHAVTCANGSAALHLPYFAMLRPGDEVLVPSFTFIATASMVVASTVAPTRIRPSPAPGLFIM